MRFLMEISLKMWRIFPQLVVEVYDQWQGNALGSADNHAWNLRTSAYELSN